MKTNTVTRVLLACLVLVSGIGSVAIWEQSRLAYAQTLRSPEPRPPVLTRRETNCEKITPRNQDRCAGPETNQKIENCEAYYVSSKLALENMSKSIQPHHDAAISAAYGVMYQNCLARNKR